MQNYEYVEENGIIYAQPTAKHKKRQENIMLKAKLAQSSLPIRHVPFDFYIGEDINGNIPKFEKYLNEFDSKFKSVNLYLWSAENGTQKTTMAQSIGCELVKKGFTVQFILMDKLVKLLMQEPFSDSFIRKLELCRRADLLIVDDAFDPKKVTLYKSGFQLPYLDTFLRERIEGDRKAIIFTSNVSILNIGDYFGKSIQELVNRSSYAFHMNDYASSVNNFESLWD